MGNPATRMVISDKGTTVCEACVIADRAPARLKGLLGRSRLPRGEGMLITPARSIHTWFMRFAIDVVFLSRDLEVLDVVEAVGPWRAVGRRGARAVLELPAGEGRRRAVNAGDRLSLVAPGSIRPPVVFVRAGTEPTS